MIITQPMHTNTSKCYEIVRNTHAPKARRDDRDFAIESANGQPPSGLLATASGGAGNKKNQNSTKISRFSKKYVI